MEFLVVVDDQVYQNLVIAELKHEARLSDRQIRMAEWSQFADGKMKTWRNREVKLSDELFNAIASLPVKGERVFKIKHSSLLLDMPEPPKREAAPVITDETEILAKLIAEKLLK
jgi:hypothetical protein